jgi:putative DNA primase/helicase
MAGNDPVRPEESTASTFTSISTPDRIHDNDYGNACRLISAHGEILRYCHELKSWLIWDGQRWSLDHSGQVRHLAESVIKDFWRDVSRDTDRRNFASSSLNKSRISDMLVSSQHRLPISPASLDSDPDLLNFLNGTVDLRTSALSPHFPLHYITRLVHYDYNPSATCPRFLSFLASIFAPHPTLSSYLQLALGYSLTAHTREKVVFMPYGPGENGKSTLLGLFRSLIPEYSALLQIDTLMTRQENNNTQADLADLRGTRFVMTSETDKGQRLAEGKLKRITQGVGGRIKSARKYENHIEFDETHKLWIDANNLPVVRGTDNAIWNRLSPIPFSVTFSPAEQDKTLASKLAAEAEGILAWAVEGARLWFARGLDRHSQIDLHRSQWRAQSDQITSFFQECCEIGNEGELSASELYEAYERWVRGEDDTPYSKSDFIAALQKQPGIVKKKLKTRNVYRGVKLRWQSGSVASLAVEDQGEGEEE